MIKVIYVALTVSTLSVAFAMTGVEHNISSKILYVIDKLAGTDININSIQLESIDTKMKILWSNQLNKKLVYSDGKLISQIPKRYGKNVFYFVSEGKEVCVLSHTKTNYWHQYRYEFRLKNENDKLECTGLAVGPSDWGGKNILVKLNSKDL